MRVEVLYFEGCPNHKPAVDRVKDVLRQECLPEVVQEIEVRDTQTAQRLRFLGSPSIRIDGVDIEPAARQSTDFGLVCRTYSEGDCGRAGLPSTNMIRSALRGQTSAISQASQPRHSLLFLGSAVSAVAASLCCILPIIAAVTGAATLGAAASFEQWRPYLLSVTGVFFIIGLVFAIRDQRRACVPGSACATKPMNRMNFLILGLLALFIIAAAAFPSYSGRVAELVSPRRTSSTVGAGAHLVTTSFLVPDMDCPACAVGLRTSFEKLRGVSRATVDYNSRRATITYNPAQLQAETFIRIVSAAGFHVKQLG